MRQCGECQLCCRLLPVRELEKVANERCKHQRFRKGCAIYAERPLPCALWSCVWLINNDAADLIRPDKSHYVIDMMPEFITLQWDDGSTQHVEVVQIWCDPRFPHAHRDPKLRAFLERRAQEGIIGLVRFGSKQALTLIAPGLNDKGVWIEHEGRASQEHSVAEIIEKLGYPDAISNIV